VRKSMGLIVALSAFFVLGPGSGPVSADDRYEHCNKALKECRVPCNKMEDDKRSRDCENDCLRKSNVCADEASYVRLTRNPKSLTSELQNLPRPAAGMKYDSSCVNTCVSTYNSCIAAANSVTPKQSGGVLAACDNHYDDCKRPPKCQVKAK